MVKVEGSSPSYDTNLYLFHFNFYYDIFHIFLYFNLNIKYMKNSNNYDEQRLRGVKRKYEAILKLGGKCSRCGYCYNIAALDFHHLDPNEKEFNLDSRRFSNTSLEKLEKEISKCALLCANCHREEHNQDLTFEIVEKLEIDKTSFFNKIEKKFCPICNNNLPKGRKYCSDICKVKSVDINKEYPSIEDINIQYDVLKSWGKSC